MNQLCSDCEHQAHRGHATCGICPAYHDNDTEHACGSKHEKWLKETDARIRILRGKFLSGEIPRRHIAWSMPEWRMLMRRRGRLRRLIAKAGSCPVHVISCTNKPAHHLPLGIEAEPWAERPADPGAK